MVGQHLLQHPDLARDVDVDLGGERFRRLDGLRALAGHGGGEGEEVDVVRVVREGIDALRLLALDEDLSEWMACWFAFTASLQRPTRM